MGARRSHNADPDRQAERLFRAQECLDLPSEALRDVDAISCADALLASRAIRDEFPFMSAIVNDISSGAKARIEFSFASCDHLLSSEDEVAHTFAVREHTGACDRAGYAVCFRGQRTCLSTLLHELAHVVDMTYETDREHPLGDCSHRHDHDPVFAAILLRLILIECGRVAWLRAKVVFRLSGVPCAPRDWHRRDRLTTSSAARRPGTPCTTEMRRHRREHLRAAKRRARQRQRAIRHNRRSRRDARSRSVATSVDCDRGASPHLRADSSQLVQYATDAVHCRHV